jgi:hypothetical protein
MTDKPDKRSASTDPPSREPAAPRNAVEEALGAKQNRLTPPDIFARQSKYPDAASIFRHSGRNPRQMLEECIVTLDTNALLVPYGAGASSMSAIQGVYAKLAREGRLLVPAHAAREFADHRGAKLGEVFQHLSKKRDFQLPRTEGKHTLLESEKLYADMLAAEKGLQDQAKAYREIIDRLTSIVQDWAWNDPVSRAYEKVFADAVVELTLDRATIIERLQYRQANQIPPGYKDKAKNDEGVGDLLIWFTVLQVAAEKQRDLLFVTGEEKPDWWHRSGGQTLYPRYELVDEFRRASGGKSFAMCKLSELLELMQVNDSVVSDAKSAEEKQAAIRRDLQGKYDIASQKFREALQIVRAVSPGISGSSAPSESTLQEIARRVVGRTPRRGRRFRAFNVVCDYETSARAGAAGTFQVIELQEDGQDVTHLVDQGIHFSDIEELQLYLQTATGGDDVHVEEIG